LTLGIKTHSAFMLSAAIYKVMLNVIMLSVIMLNVVAPYIERERGVLEREGRECTSLERGLERTRERCVYRLIEGV
jgi:hypothetical protein